MSTPALPNTHATSRDTRRLVLVLAAGAVGLFAAALILWARYGGAVFLETMANAWAYCF